MATESYAYTLRALRDEAQREVDQGDRLQAPHGTVPVGGADIDHFARGYALHRYLDCLGTMAPERALEETKKEARAFFENHNRRWQRDYVVQRWEGGADSWLDDRHRQVLRADAAATGKELR